MFENIAASLPELYTLLQWVAYAIGLTYVSLGIMGLIHVSADPRQSDGPASAISSLALGGILMAFNWWAPMLTASVTDGIDTSPLQVLSKASTGAASDSAFAQMMRNVLGLVSFFGYLAIFRGVMLFRRVSQPGGQHGGEDAVFAAITHIGFGALAANNLWTIKQLAALMNFPIPSFIS